MGQYYKAVSLKNLEFLTSRDFESGAKLMEHSWSRNTYVGAVCNLLSPGGAWENSGIVWAGDYADEELFVPDDFENKKDVNLYQIATINDVITDDLKNFTGIVMNIIINHTLKEFVDVNKCPDTDGWIIHPLPLLTASGNGRGGGDYNGDNEELVGTWAGHSISTNIISPSDYTEIFPNFIEISRKTIKQI